MVQEFIIADEYGPSAVASDNALTGRFDVVGYIERFDVPPRITVSGKYRQGDRMVGVAFGCSGKFKQL